MTKLRQNFHKSNDRNDRKGFHDLTLNLHQSEGCERGYLILVRVGMGLGPWGRVGVGGVGVGVGVGGVGGGQG